MCRSVPARLLRIDGMTGFVEADGTEQAVSLLAVADVTVGDYVYYQAGLALAKLDPDEAREILAILAEIEQAILEDTT
ncbi:MAG TPA: HypC/HybG/HupF family hydrogenase formation chaperone [Chloroflexota bacterium]|nr:HypC/HybG/HupF family hydrogenase formation chaperone [Chloroflexota bacterium]